MAEEIKEAIASESPKEPVIEQPKPELTSADLEKQIMLLKAEKEKSEVPAVPVEVPVTPVVTTTQENQPEKVEPAPVVQTPQQEPLKVDSFEIKPQPVVEQNPQTQPVADPVAEFNAWAKENILVDPVGTYITIQKILERPKAIEKRKVDLMGEIMKLTTSPDTQEFNNPNVRSEMEKVFAENPTRYVDELSIVRPEYLKDIYYIAKGRTKSVPVNNVVERPAPIEGRNHATKSASVDTASMTASELEAHIKSLVKG